MPWQLPPLPFAPDALEPHMDAKTQEIHHGKHHATYVTNLNNAIQKHPELDGLRCTNCWPMSARLCPRTSARLSGTTAVAFTTTTSGGRS